MNNQILPREETEAKIAGDAADQADEIALQPGNANMEATKAAVGLLRHFPKRDIITSQGLEIPPDTAA